MVISRDIPARNQFYLSDSSTDLTVLPGNAAVWAKQDTKNGISYVNGANTGFIEVDDVMVAASLAEAVHDVAAAITCYHSDLQTSINGTVITVTGSIQDADTTLVLSIPEGISVQWRASVTAAETLTEALIDLFGGGAFEVADRGAICAVAGTAINSFHADSSVLVSGGTVSATSLQAIYSKGDIMVSGGTVSSAGSQAIWPEADVTVSGGTICSSSDFPIFLGYCADMSVTGGALFFWDTADNMSRYASLQSGNSVFIAWNQGVGTTRYDIGSSIDLAVLPATASATWTRQNGVSGIAYANGDNAGFIPVNGVMVKTYVTGVDQTYLVKTNRADAYGFNLLTLLPEGVASSEVSAFHIVASTNAGIVFNGTPSISGTTLTLPVAAVATAGLRETVSIGFTSANYRISDAVVTVETVDKTPVTITTNPIGGVYHGQPYGCSNATVSRSADGSDVTGSVVLEARYEGINGTAYESGSDAPTRAGNYQLTLSVPDAHETFTGSAIMPFTIGKRPVTIKVDDKQMSAGGSLPALTYTLEGQLAGETALTGEPSLHCQADGTVAGRYDITVQLAGIGYSANYAAASPANENGTLTVRAPSSGNDTPSGGGTDTPVTPAPAITPVTPAPTVSGSTATTTVTASTGSDGKAKASVTQSQVASAIESAQKAALGTGTAARVEIQVSGATNAGNTETTLPKAAVQALVTGKIGALTLSSPVADMTFDAQALAAIVGTAGGDVVFTASTVENSTLSDAARLLVGTRPVVHFSVTSGGNTISRFDGAVTIALPYTPAAGEDTNAVVSYYINADGEPELMQNCRYDAQAGTLVFTTTHFSDFAVGYNKIAFSDVSGTAWHADAISFLAAREITSGTTKTTFSPDATLTRGQFISLLLRAYGIAPDSHSASNFSDAGNTYYTGYLAAARRLKITNGVGDDKFAPEQAISRQDMFTLLYNALKTMDRIPEGNSGNTLSAFSDSGRVALYAQEAMACLVNAGTVSGDHGRLSPTDTTTRAQTAQVLYNLLSR